MYGSTSQKLLFSFAAVFGLILLTGCETDKLRGERDALWAQNQQLQEELDQARAAQDAAESRASRLQGEVNRLQSELASAPTSPAPRPAASTGATGFEMIQDTEIIRSPGIVTVRIPGDVLFQSGKAELRSNMMSSLDQIAAVIQRQYPNNTIRVEGYTDTDPIRRSGWKDNLELSLQRAASVQRYLQSKGIDPKRLYSAGFGEFHPRSTKAQSRRVEIVVITD